MKRGDIWLFSLLVIVIASLFISYSVKTLQAGKYTGKTYAKIELDGDSFKTIELTSEPQDIEIVTDLGYDLLRVSNQGIQVIESDCPDKICISYGFIDKVGEMIICLPNRMTIEIIGDGAKSAEVDYVTY